MNNNLMRPTCHECIHASALLLGNETELYRVKFDVLPQLYIGHCTLLQVEPKLLTSVPCFASFALHCIANTRRLVRANVGHHFPP